MHKVTINLSPLHFFTLGRHFPPTCLSPISPCLRNFFALSYPTRCPRKQSRYKCSRLCGWSWEAYEQGGQEVCHCIQRPSQYRSCRVEDSDSLSFAWPLLQAVSKVVHWSEEPAPQNSCGRTLDTHRCSVHHDRDVRHLCSPHSRSRHTRVFQVGTFCCRSPLLNNIAVSSSFILIIIPLSIPWIECD